MSSQHTPTTKASTKTPNQSDKKDPIKKVFNLYYINLNRKKTRLNN